MKNRLKNNSSSNQLRWVILLLGVAVILPTICLLWFMTQAIKNERLAVRQKLIDSYTSRGEEIFFKELGTWIDGVNDFSASIVYDSNDKIIYPVWSDKKIILSSDDIQTGWVREFADANYIKAIKEYESISEKPSSPDERYQCQIGVIRCLAKQKKFNDAVKKCTALAYPGKETINKFSPEQIGYTRLMLANLYSRSQQKQLLDELRKQLTDTLQNSIPTETQIFILQELITLAQKLALAGKLNAEIQTAKKIITSASLSIMAADYFNADTAAQEKPNKTFFKIKTARPLYCIKFRNDDKKAVRLLTTEKMRQLWQKSVDDFTDKLVFCRIYDDKGEKITGEQGNYRNGEKIPGDVFATLKLKEYFNGWKAKLYLRGGVFKETADKNKAAYMWISFTVIILMLLSTITAGKAVLKQAKLNRLKNNFIATVSHELKTPLSSMRVLVDTLLEGNYNNQKQATEYLQLISKENLRLSRLIDNFLSFSRMERNKQAFDIVKNNPVEIVTAAAEAMQTKFHKKNCNFTISVDDNLSDVYADKDAMVTVLVNLLDNACKYSYNDKQIKLRVFSRDGFVCFSVKDNGIGMTARQTRKIFNRFYQADSTLSRQAEGTGLGLSIVKFIVDAHKGQINVESKPNKGSEFVIKIPI